MLPPQARRTEEVQRQGSGGVGAPALHRSMPSLQAARALWLDAWSDPVACVTAYGGCVHTCNLFGDGDWRLVVADADGKLKIWKGTQRASEHALLERPTALTSFIPSAAPPRIPLLAVAASCHVYMFKALKPYFKFVLPPAPCSEEEQQLWKELDAGTVGPSDACAMLLALRDAGAPLSDRGTELLAAAADKGDGAAAAYVAATRGEEPGRRTAITCMDTINLAVDEPDAPCCLVLGTEDGRLLVLNAAGSAVQHSADLGAAPSFLAASGSLDGGFRLSATTRDGRLHTLRGFGPGCAAVAQLDAPAVGLVRLGAAAAVGCMGGALHCYGGKGGAARLFSAPQPAAIVCMQLLATHTSRLAKCVLVALANGEVRVYNERVLVSSHTTPAAAPATALAFGRYAREDSTLVTVTKGGGLDIKIMPRHANLEVSAAPAGPPPEQDRPLPVPTKTRLYLEQTQREREGAVDMHHHFQRDLVRARLETARALVKVLTDGQGASSRAPAANLSMSAAVEGLGPRFRLVVAVTNEGAAAVGGLVVVAHCDPQLYSLGRHQLSVPLLVPLLEYRLAVDVRCLQPAAAAGEVRLSVVAPGGAAPLMSALVRMPLSEPEDVA